MYGLQNYWGHFRGFFKRNPFHSIRIQMVIQLQELQLVSLLASHILWVKHDETSYHIYHSKPLGHQECASGKCNKH